MRRRSHDELVAAYAPLLPGDRAGRRRHGAADAGRVPAGERPRGRDASAGSPSRVLGAGRLARRRRSRAGTQTLFDGAFVVDGFAPLHEGADLRRPAPAPCSCRSTTCARPARTKFEYPVLVLLATAGMVHDDLGQRPDRALSRPRAAEPGALRGGRHPPRRRALERGGPQVFRAGRAVVGHAALRRLADLRLHRLDQLHGHRRRRQGQRRRRRTSA